jgi:hypothetical protein
MLTLGQRTVPDTLGVNSAVGSRSNQDREKR